MFLLFCYIQAVFENKSDGRQDIVFSFGTFTSKSVNIGSLFELNECHMVCANDLIC